MALVVEDSLLNSPLKTKEIINLSKTSRFRKGLIHCFTVTAAVERSKL